MRKFKLIASIFITAFLITGCRPKEISELPGGASFYKNFVQAYIIPDSIRLEFYHERCISIIFDEGTEVEPFQADKNADIYKALSIKYVDTSYNQKIAYGKNLVLAEDFDSILVVCDKDFNPTHLAGAPLTDVIKICTSTCYPFISNGYKYTEEDHRGFEPDHVGTIRRRNGGEGYSVLFKFLNELTPRDMKMLFPCWTLYFQKLPQSGIYTFTVTLKNSKKQYQKSITCEF